MFSFEVFCQLFYWYVCHFEQVFLWVCQFSQKFWWCQFKNVCFYSVSLIQVTVIFGFIDYSRFQLPIKSTRGCLPSLRLPTRKFWTCSKNSGRDREAKCSRSHREMIGYWLSSGRVDRETIVFGRDKKKLPISTWSTRLLFDPYPTASRSMRSLFNLLSRSTRPLPDRYSIEFLIATRPYTSALDRDMILQKGRADLAISHKLLRTRRYHIYNI